MQGLNILAKNCQKIVLFLCSRNISNKEKNNAIFQASNLNTLLYLTKKNEFVPTLIYIIIKIYIFLFCQIKKENLIKKENWFAEQQDCFFLVRKVLQKEIQRKIAYYFDRYFFVQTNLNKRRILECKSKQKTIIAPLIRYRKRCRKTRK